LRWFGSALILAPFALPLLRKNPVNLRALGPELLLLGFLGMGICGGLVYVALGLTTASNAALIYTTMIVQILILERLFRKAPLGWRQLAGIVLSFLGVMVIVFRGDFDQLTRFRFNSGDALILFAAFSWAIYSVILKRKSFEAIGTLPLFFLIVSSGAIVLFPAAVIEVAIVRTFPHSAQAWLSIAAIIVFPSILSFSSYLVCVRKFGPSITGIAMYLLPIYGVGLAVLFLSERLALFHFIGIALVLPGVVLATFARRSGHREKNR